MSEAKIAKPAKPAKAKKPAKKTECRAYELGHRGCPCPDCRANKGQ